MALSASGSGASRSIVYRLIADATGVLAGTRQASASMKKLGDDVTAVSKEGEKTRKGFDQMGRTAGRVGLIAAAGLGAMVLKAANFESAMSQVAAATHESEENMKRLRDAAIDAGARTQFSANEAANAIENLAKAGVSTADILKGGLAGSLSLAAAGMLPVADAAEDIATALTQFQLSGKEATHVADLLAAGAGKAQGEVSDMANALKYAGVPAANLGVSIEETAGAIALFAKNGIIGEQAGTSLRGMLSSLTSPSAAASKTIESLGIDMFDAKGKFIGLAGVADQLRSNMKTLTDEERANALGKIFGNEQLQAANVLYREGAKGVEDWTGKVDDAGFAAETARIKTDNLRGDLERLGGAIDSALIKGGQGSQGFLRDLTQGATRAIDAFNALPSSISNLVPTMLGITAITGGGLWFGSKMVRQIADTREALKNLEGAGKGAGKAMKGVALAAAGFSALQIAFTAVDALQKKIDETLPGLNSMQRRLISIAHGSGVSVLGEQFDSLGQSIERIRDSSFSFDSFGRFQGNATGFSDMLSAGADAILPFDQTAKSLREAEAEVGRLDEALGSLVTSGHSKIAADSLEAIGVSMGLTDEQMQLLRTHLPQYKDALEGAAVDAALAGDAHVGMGKKVKIAGQAIHFTADQIKDAQDAYDKQRSAAGDIADGFLDISKNADKAKVSLGRWLTGLEKQARALEEFTANAKLAAKNGLNDAVIDQLERLGTAGALRLKQLAHGTKAEVDRANQVFGGLAKARDAFQDTVKKPIEIRTDVKVIDDEARRKERALRQKFVTFPKSISTQIKWDNHAADVGLNHLEARLARLRQLAIITPRIKHTEDRLNGHAAGGHIRGPGSGTSDSIPAYLSNGEYVIKSAAVARYGVAMFDRLNAMHFAQGGPVGGGSSAGIDYDTLGRVIASYTRGDTINVTAQDMRDIDRQLAERRARSSSDGIRR